MTAARPQQAPAVAGQALTLAEHLHRAIIDGQEQANRTDDTPPVAHDFFLLEHILGDVETIRVDFWRRLAATVPETCDPGTRCIREDVEQWLDEFVEQLAWYLLTAGWMRVNGGEISRPHRLYSLAEREHRLLAMEA